MQGHNLAPNVRARYQPRLANTRPKLPNAKHGRDAITVQDRKRQASVCVGLQILLVVRKQFNIGGVELVQFAHVQMVRIPAHNTVIPLHPHNLVKFSY